MRKIKFRAWQSEDKLMVYLDPLSWSLSAVITGDKWDVMQFTGLLDAKGKEIYEGDIVKYKYTEQEREGYTPREYTNEVVFKDGQFTPKEEKVIIDEDNFYSYMFYDFEVIGNVYENKDLLGK